MKRSLGFTLVEMLIVLSIISILTIVGVANFKDFAKQQVIIKAADQIHTLLRLAQRNASSSVKCSDSEAAVSWLVDFKNYIDDPSHKIITLSCKSTSGEVEIKRLVLDSNIEVSQVITDPACPTVDFPNYSATFIYNTPLGKIDFVVAREVSSFECHPNSQTVRVVLRDNQAATLKDIIISKGGEINIQNTEEGDSGV